jgi:hypothetical protein
LLRGLPTLRVPRQNTPVKSELPRATRVTDQATQRVASIWHIWGPAGGDLVSSSFVPESQLGGFLHAPLCVLAPSHPGFPARDYAAKMLETTRFGFNQGGISPYWILWSIACPGWLSLLNYDPGSTQILTRHYSAQSQTVRHLMNLGTMFARHVPIVQPLWVF